MPQGLSNSDCQNTSFNIALYDPSQRNGKSCHLLLLSLTLFLFGVPFKYFIAIFSTSDIVLPPNRIFFQKMSWNWWVLSLPPYMLNPKKIHSKFCENFHNIVDRRSPWYKRWQRHFMPFSIDFIISKKIV